MDNHTHLKMVSNGPLKVNGTVSVANPGSTSVTNVNLTIDPTKTNVFFRLGYP